MKEHKLEDKFNPKNFEEEIYKRWEEKEYFKPSEDKTKKPYTIATPQLNFVVSSYYKGTGMEEVLGKMEKYLDEDAKDNSEIVNI